LAAIVPPIPLNSLLTYEDDHLCFGPVQTSDLVRGCNLRLRGCGRWPSTAPATGWSSCACSLELNRPLGVGEVCREIVFHVFGKLRGWTLGGVSQVHNILHDLTKDAVHAQGKDTTSSPAKSGRQQSKPQLNLHTHVRARLQSSGVSQ
jgi:hypothetical protein